MVAFTCNVCGNYNEVQDFATEPASCPCGSNVRLRALVYLISKEMFGRSLLLQEFPRLKSIRAMGMTDKDSFARVLAERFDYTNTYYDREPRFDITERHPGLSGAYDFIVSSDVIEHIAPPIEQALEEMRCLLGPRGFLAGTLYCNAEDRLREHFPELYEFRIVPLGAKHVLINRKRDGSLEIREDLIFHGGSGSTLEMREFGITDLTAKLLCAGFREVHYLTVNVPEIGILFDHDVSQPFIARKEPFLLNAGAAAELVDEWYTAQEACHAARARTDELASRMIGSRWIGLGRKLGLGPRMP